MKVKIKDIAAIQTGVYLKAMSGGQVRYLQVKDFDKTGQYNDSYPSIAMNDKVEKYLLSENDLLFAAKGFFNFCAVYHREWGNAVASSSFLVLKIKDKMEIMPEYFSWTLNRSDIRAMFRNVTPRSVMPSITKTMLEELEIIIPEFAVQQRIVAIAELQRQEQMLSKKMIELEKKLIEKKLIKVIEKY
jgi:restriction endonuclease S subunit